MWEKIWALGKEKTALVLSEETREMKVEKQIWNWQFFEKCQKDREDDKSRKIIEKLDEKERDTDRD